MTTRLGPQWWDITATSELTRKVSQRKNNEQVFAPLIDNSAYLIDFGDLGRLIYAHSSGFTSREDIIAKVAAVEETPEAIRQLKEQLKSNYQKFFKESFKDRGFQEKWEEMEKLRHKVAHSNLFTKVDLTRGLELAAELVDIVETATASVEALVLAAEEKTAIKESFVAHGFFDVISQEEFLSQLAERQSYYEKTEGFVGLAHFVKGHLGGQGYDYKSSYELASALAAQGIVEIYRVPNPDGDYETAAIRLIRGAA